MRTAKRRALFASPALAKSLGQSPSLSKLATVPWVLPVSNKSGGQFLPSDDGCPLPREQRLTGHEAVTVGVALEMAAATNQLVFGPVISARPLLAAGRLVEVAVSGWNLTESLYLHANGDLVLARIQKSLVEALRATARAG